LLPKAGICTLAELTALSCLPFPQHYWPRLLITCGGWVANDFAFYGVRGSKRKNGMLTTYSARSYVNQQHACLHAWGTAWFGSWRGCFAVTPL